MGPAEGDAHKSADDDRSRGKERPGARQTNRGTTTASCCRASTCSASSPFRETSRSYRAASEGSAPAEVLSSTLNGQTGETCPGRGSQTSQSFQSLAGFRAYFRAYTRESRISGSRGCEWQSGVREDDSLLRAREQFSEAGEPVHVRYL